MDYKKEYEALLQTVQELSKKLAEAEVARVRSNNIPALLNPNHGVDCQVYEFKESLVVGMEEQ